MCTIHSRRNRETGNSRRVGQARKLRSGIYRQRAAPFLIGVLFGGKPSATYDPATGFLRTTDSPPFRACCKTQRRSGKKPQEAQNAQKGARILCFLCFLWLRPLPFKVLQHPVSNEGNPFLKILALLKRLTEPPAVRNLRKGLSLFLALADGLRRISERHDRQHVHFFRNV